MNVGRTAKEDVCLGLGFRLATRSVMYNSLPIYETKSILFKLSLRCQQGAYVEALSTVPFRLACLSPLI